MSVWISLDASARLVVEAGVVVGVDCVAAGAGLSGVGVLRGVSCAAAVASVATSAAGIARVWMNDMTGSLLLGMGSSVFCTGLAMPVPLAAGRRVPCGSLPCPILVFPRLF